MATLNYNHLRYFWAVARLGNLTRAAEQLHLSQSAVSVQLQKLERQIGHKLFERSGKALILTEAGKIALDYADTVFKAGDELLGTLKGNFLTNRQILRVGALPTLSRNFQLEFLRPILARPDVEIVVRSGAMRELLAQLDAHTLDIVLANTPAPRDSHSILRNHLIDEQPVSLVGHPKRGRKKFLFPEDLQTWPLLLPSMESDIRLAFDRVLERAGIHPLILAEVDDMAMLRLLARERQALTVVPPIVVQDELENKILVEYCRIGEVSERFYAIVQKRRFPNKLLAELLQ
ncbi:LysR family transcriptional regulator [Bradyrhizobium sp. BR13661]|jgi:LysR family transcriptional activator of nhaA|uniref:LysR family transcriptional regulator n=1 Tax=Bradyrhizobium sp. BR13661 TaxID=2940622 RepID=UPI0024759044|nr:LysR family transcriptional regulator [Bradyrhizobium sp. BR13661]MDH6257543.1 LysR family transcriptional activator of nhaA [Bradyrhizobium sp. BR13661]